MWWRRARSEFERNKGAGNKRAMKRLVQKGDPPGLLGYVGGDPVAWIAFAPREDYGVLGRSRILKPVDEQAVWSVTCFFVRKDHRRLGLTARMLEAAVKCIKRSGGRIVEGYPVEPKKDEMPDAFAWTGLAAAFKRAGFKEVARRSPTRPIMRRALR